MTSMQTKKWDLVNYCDASSIEKYLESSDNVTEASDVHAQFEQDVSEKTAKS